MMSERARRTGLRSKIVVWTFVPTAIILAAIALVSFYAYGQVTEDLVIERNQELTKILADQLSAELQEYVQTLSIIDTYYEIDPTDFQFQPDRNGPSVGWLQPFDGGVLMLNSLGDVAYGSGSRSQLQTFAFSKLDAYRTAVEERRATWSDIENVAGQDIIILFVPMIGAQGEVRGALVGMFLIEGGTRTRLSDFYVTIFAKLKIANRENVYVVDRNGRAILHTDTYRIGEDIAGQAIVQRVMEGQVGGIRTHNLQDREIVASFAPVPGTPWSLVTEESWADLTRVSQRYRHLLLVLLGLGGILPVIALTVGVRRITQPIADLIRAAREVAGGNFDQRIQVSSGDELEEMAAQFNVMAAELQESYATLERRVSDRTRELAALNAIAAVVSRSLDMEEILQNALDMTLEVTAMEAGAALWLRPDDGLPTLVAYRRLPDGLLGHVAQLAQGPDPTRSPRHTERPAVHHICEYPVGPLQQAAKRAGLQLIVTVPLMTKGRLLGTLNLVSSQLHSFSDEELNLLAGIGQQVGMAVENAQLYDQAEEAAAAAERSRLARDLHDAVTQTLFSASLIADILPRLWERNPTEAFRRLEQVRQLTRGALAEMRTLLLELRPSVLQEASLDELLQQLAAAAAGRTMLQVDLDLDHSCEMPIAVKEAFYRIAQESLNNVIKHAGAQHTAIGLRCSQADAKMIRIAMWISDDGRGFDPKNIPPDHLGVGIMRERADGIGADLVLTSVPGTGTRIHVTWTENDPRRE
jgi:nitrate/nitrite-specific signal transduction histidine kinase